MFNAVVEVAVGREKAWHGLVFVDLVARGVKMSPITSVRLIANELPKSAHSIRVFWIFWVVSI